MTQPLYGAASRQPLTLNGKKVEYGTTRRLKDGTLVYEFTPPREPGKPKPSPQVLKGITTATDAKHEIERLLPITRGGTIGDRSIRLEALYQNCLAAMKSGEFKHSEGRYSEATIALFKTRAENHVLPGLGSSMIVGDIKTAHLRKLMTRLTGQGQSGSSVRGCLAVASTLLRYAVEQEVMDTNPASNIGRGERPSSKRKSEPRYLSIPEVELLLAEVTDETSKAVIASMFWGALRVSEALELRWSDVGETTLLVRGTKTDSSYGEIPLLPQLAAVLAAHRTRMGKLGFDRIQPDALIFQTGPGKRMSRRNILRSIHAAGDAAGLNPEGTEKVGNHDLRHSMAANALAFVSMTEAANLLRHSNPQITATTYADLTKDGVKALGEKLAAGFSS
jgi:Site-specific recombinase XerD